MDDIKYHYTGVVPERNPGYVQAYFEDVKDDCPSFISSCVLVANKDNESLRGESSKSGYNERISHPEIAVVNNLTRKKTRGYRVLGVGSTDDINVKQFSEGEKQFSFVADGACDILIHPEDKNNLHIGQKLFMYDFKRESQFIADTTIMSPGFYNVKLDGPCHPVRVKIRSTITNELGMGHLVGTILDLGRDDEPFVRVQLQCGVL